MLVYRLCREKYAHSLSGKGAALSNNRWNSKGFEIIYTAESRALALAEILVHLSLQMLPQDYQVLEIEIPDDLAIQELKAEDLPSNWRDNPAPPDTRLLGDQFLKSGKTAIMRVPSAVVAGDYNILINPQHKSFKSVKIKSISPFPIDIRLKQ